MEQRIETTSRDFASNVAIGRHRQKRDVDAVDNRSTDMKVITTPHAVGQRPSDAPKVIVPTAQVPNPQHEQVPVKGGTHDNTD